MFGNVATAMADKYSGFVQGSVHYTKSLKDLYLRLAKMMGPISQKGQKSKGTCKIGTF
jgi:hypothetical protein